MNIEYEEFSCTPYHVSYPDLVLRYYGVSVVVNEQIWICFYNWSSYFIWIYFVFTECAFSVPESPPGTPFMFNYPGFLGSSWLWVPLRVSLLCRTWKFWGPLIRSTVGYTFLDFFLLLLFLSLLDWACGFWGKESHRLSATVITSHQEYMLSAGHHCWCWSCG